MNRRIRLALVLASPVLLFVPVTGDAQTSCSSPTIAAQSVSVASMVICANGRRFDVPNLAIEGKFTSLPHTTFDLGNGASFSLSGSYNADPFVNFTFGSILPSGFGPITFDVYFTTPVIGGPYNTARSYFTENLTLTAPAGATGASGTVSPGNYQFYVSGSTNLGSLGVDVGTGTCTLSIVSSIVCPPGDRTMTVAPISPTFLTARLSYTQGTAGTGATSTVGWTGGIELTSVTTTVPEPSTVVMLSVGLLLLGAVVRRKHEQA